jgi:hypothetical protein
MKMSINLDEKKNTIESVCPLCEAEKVQKIKDYFAKIEQSWVDWHARHGTYIRKS